MLTDKQVKLVCTTLLGAVFAGSSAFLITKGCYAWAITFGSGSLFALMEVLD